MSKDLEAKHRAHSWRTGWFVNRRPVQESVWDGLPA